MLKSSLCNDSIETDDVLKHEHLSSTTNLKSPDDSSLIHQFKRTFMNHKDYYYVNNFLICILVVLINLLATLTLTIND